MLKKISLFIVTCAMIVFIAACGGVSTGLSEDLMTLDELNDFMKDGTGFVFVTSETNVEYYQEQKKPIENALKESNESAVTFNVYMNDGKTVGSEDINPYSDDELKVNALNYVKNGQLVDSFQFSKYDGYDMQQALNEFVKSVNK